MTECPICYDHMTPKTNNCTLSCSHAFHLKCMTTWMETNQTCPMCRMDFSDTEEEPTFGPEYKTMGNVHITEAQIQRIQNEARVSRGFAIREAQEAYDCEYWLEDEDMEIVIENAKMERRWMIRMPLSEEPEWDEVTPECEAYRQFRAMFGEKEERKAELSAKCLRIRHRFSGFYDWHNTDWDNGSRIVDGYVTD